MNHRVVSASAALAAVLLVSLIAVASEKGMTTESANGWLGVRADVVFGGKTVTVNDILVEKPFQCVAKHFMMASGWACDAEPSRTGLQEIAVQCVDECIQAYSGGKRLDQCRHDDTVVEEWQKNGDCKERHVKAKKIWDFPESFEQIDLRKLLCEKARARVPAEHQSTFQLKNLELWGRRDRQGDRKDFRKIMFYESYSCNQPDLIVESLTITPSNPKAGDKITFATVIKNVGGVAAGPVQATIRVGAGSVPTMQVPKLDPGATWSPTRAIHLDAQNYLVEVTVDPAGIVAEGDEGNNIRSKSVIVKAN
jgi:hypothetical protein